MAKGFLKQIGQVAGDVAEGLSPALGFVQGQRRTRDAQRSAERTLAGQEGPLMRAANQGAARAANARGLTGGMAASLQASAQIEAARQLAAQLAQVKLQGAQAQNAGIQGFQQNLIGAIGTGLGAGGMTLGGQGSAATAQPVPVPGADPGFRPADPVGTGQQAMGSAPAPQGAAAAQSANVGMLAGQGQTNEPEFDPDSGAMMVHPDQAQQLMQIAPDQFQIIGQSPDGRVLLDVSDDALFSQFGSPFDAFEFGFGGID